MLLIPPFNFREGAPSVRIGYYGLKIPAFTQKKDVFSYFLTQKITFQKSIG